VTAGDVYRALWRHRLFILALTAVCVGAAWYATSRQERTYEASTLVRIQQPTSDAGETLAALQASERLARTYATIIGSDALRGPIAASVAAKVPLADFSNVQVDAEPVEDLGLLWISARSADPARSAIVANAVPPVLRAFNENTGAVRDQIVTIKSATKPSSPSAPDTGLEVGLAVLLALLFNSGLVLLFEVLRDRLPESDELGQELGYPVLGTIPALRLRRVGDVEVAAEDDVLAKGRARREGAATVEATLGRHEPGSENE
jgi:capsular polysaccharide biosynthesis protein